MINNNIKKALFAISFVCCLTVMSCSDNIDMYDNVENVSTECIRIRGRIDASITDINPYKSSRGYTPQKGEYGDGSLIKYVTYIVYQDGKAIYDSRNDGDREYKYDNGKFEIKIDKVEKAGDMYVFVWADAWGNSVDSPYAIDAENHKVKVDYYKSIGSYDMADAFACYQKIYDSATGETNGNVVLERPFIRIAITSGDLRDAIKEEDEWFEEESAYDELTEDDRYFRNQFETSFFLCPSNMMQCSNVESAVTGQNILTCKGDLMDCNICLLPDIWDFVTGEVYMNKYGIVTETDRYDSEGFPLPDKSAQTYRLPFCTPDPIENIKKQHFIIDNTWDDVNGWPAIAYMAYIFAPAYGSSPAQVGNQTEEYRSELEYFLNDKIIWPEEIVNNYNSAFKPRMEYCISRRTNSYLHQKRANGTYATINLFKILRVPYCQTRGLYDNDNVGVSDGIRFVAFEATRHHGLHLSYGGNFTKIVVESTLGYDRWGDNDFSRWE